MTGRWCWVKLERRGESWGDGLLKGDLSISVFFTGDEMPAWEVRAAAGLGTAAPLPGPPPPRPLPSRGPWARGWGPTFQTEQTEAQRSEGGCSGPRPWCPSPAPHLLSSQRGLPGDTAEPRRRQKGEQGERRALAS